MLFNFWRLSAFLVGLLATAPIGMLPASAATLTVTDPGDTGAPGQLRSLINAASPGDTIVIPAFTITLTGVAGEDANAGGDLDITKDLTIQGLGPGATVIDGGGIDRVFEIVSQFATVTISNLTIRNGRLTDQGGAGIRNRGTLTLDNVVVSGNTVAGSTSNAVAGGIFNQQGTLTMNNVTVTGNTADRGGGLFNAGASTATVSNSTLSGNAARAGGGIVNFSTLTITNSTISGNTAANDSGGISNVSTSSTLTLTNVTMSGNSAPLIGGISNGSGATTTLKNAIVANNAFPDCNGTFTSLGHNLDRGTTCGFAGLGDLSNTDPLLGPLQNYGGPTQTHALLPGSPAIDAGDNAGCPPLDQRGVARPQGAACDIGAYEFVPGSGGGPTGPANVPQIVNVATFQGTPAGGTQQQTFLPSDPITARATYYDPNPACGGVAPPVRQLFFFNPEGQLLLTREDVTSTLLAPGSKFQVLALSLAPRILGPGAYNLIFLATDCTHTNIFVSGFYPIRVLSP